MLLDAFYNITYNLIPFHWPPGQTMHSINNDADYIVAVHYFVLDSALMLMALIWGAGFTGLLIKNDRETPVAKLSFSVLAMLCISLGFITMIAALFLLALLKILTTTWVVNLFSVTSVIALYLLVLCRREIGKVILPINASDALFTIAVITILAAYQISAASLWMPSDATSFHVPYAGFFLLNQGLGAIPEHLIYPYHSLNINLLYSLGLMIDGDLSFIQTMHAMFGTLTFFGIYSFCKITNQRTFIPLLLLTLFISSFSIIHHYRYSGNVDNGSMYFGLCSVLALYLWIESKSQWLLIVSAVTFGAAIGTKYLMCAFIFPIGLCILFTQGRNWKPLAIYASWAAAWGLWWYARNFIATGNPFHPFASSIFGLYLWDATDVAQQMAGLHDERVPRSVAGFLLMPYYAYKNDILNSQGAFIQLAMLYGTTLLCWKISKPINCLLVFCWCYLVIWFFGAQDPRYLMPITPLILIYCGAIINTLWTDIFSLKIGKILSYMITPVALVAFSFFVQQEFIKIYYSDIGSSPERKDAVMRQNPTYDLMSHANEVFDKNATVYEFFMRDGRWFFKGHLVGNQFGPHGYFRIMVKSGYQETGKLSAEKLEKTLKELYDADGFILPNGNYNREEFDNYFDLKYRNDLGAVYAFKKH